MNARLILGASALAAACSAYLLRDKTTDSDETGEAAARPPLPQGSTRLGARAVEVLSRYVGERGSGPKGSAGYHRSPFIDQVNRGVYGDGKGLLGTPWCCRAVRWAYETAASELGLPPPFSGVKSDLASVSKIKKYLGAFKTGAPKVGAVLLCGDEHATLIAQVLDGRSVITIEGNHGDAVAHVRRTLRPKDTIIDVEEAARAGTALGSDLDLLGAEERWAVRGRRGAA